LVPVAFWPQTGTDAYAPLATAILGGLSIGTVLALFVVPVIHTYTGDLAILARAVVRRFSRRPAAPADGGVR
jgi:HAE1 family hydrophobic/amphiphilic exporter-1